MKVFYFSREFKEFFSLFWRRLKVFVKSILTANLKPIVIQPKIEGDEILTNLEQIEEKKEDRDANHYLL